MVTTTFVGREADVARLRRALAASPVVTVTGPAGVGKTRLAVEATRSPVEGLPVRLVSGALADLRAGVDADAIALEAGLASCDAAAAALQQEPALLVLDNCEHVLDGVSFFVTQVIERNGENRVLATSREPLGVPGEQVLVLDPLALPIGADVGDAPAVRLFLDRATAAGASWPSTPDALTAVAALCRRLDGLPLAIELAAARARTLSPMELLALMDRRLDVLQRRGAPTRAARHASLRAALDVSIDLLEPDARAAFEALGVIPGWFDRSLAGAVISGAGADPVDVVDELERLVERSLVVVEHSGASTHYRLLEVVRDRALERLIRRGDADVVAERFVDAVTAGADAMVAEGLTAWSGALIARILGWHHHLVDAAGWCVEHDLDAGRANRLLLPMLAAAHRSRPGEVLTLGQRVLGRWGDDGSPWHAEVVGVLATAAAMAGRPDTALDLGHCALAAPRASPVAAMLAHRAMAYADQVQGEHAAALAHARAGRVAAASLGAASFDRDLAALEALLLDQAGDAAEAARLLAWVVDRAGGAGDPIAEAGGRLARATLAMRGDRWDEAEREVAEARRLSDLLEHPWWEGALERYAAVLVAHQEGWDDSGPAWWAALRATGRRAAAGETALTLRLAASVAAHAGRDDVAVALLRLAPATPEVSVLPELYPEELARLDACVGPDRPAVDLPTALQRAHVLLTGSSGAELLVEQERGPRPADRVPLPDTGTLRLDGDTWTVSFAGRTATVIALKGVVDLARLVSRPGTEVHCLELMGAGAVSSEPGLVLDDQARRVYKARILELQGEIDRARDDANLHAAERAEAELDALVSQLSKAFGLGGRHRATGSTTERARSAVTYRIRTAVRRIEAVHPELGRHLANAVRTGTWCAYRPERDVTWDVAGVPTGGGTGLTM